MKGFINRISICFLLFSISYALHGKDRLILGGNFNENAQMIRWERMEESGTRLIRGFIPAYPFLNGRRVIETDKAVQNLKKAASDDYKVMLCLKWDFKGSNWRVPEKGIDLENRCFKWIDDLLKEIGNVYLLETINEVMIDTHEEDLLPDSRGRIPMVEFQKRLVDHLYASGTPPPVYMGGFTRLDREHMQTHPITLKLFDWINEDERITGTNFHIHMPEMEGFQTYLEFIRECIPEKPFIITEFSLVWKYKKAMKHPLGRFAKGKAFASQYDVDPTISVRDYINAAIDNPVPESEWNAFMRSQYWYDPQFLDKACQVMDKYGVRYAAYAFQQGSSGRGKLGPNTNPWILNPVYVPSSAVGENGKTAVNRDYFKSYHDWN